MSVAFTYILPNVGRPLFSWKYCHVWCTSVSQYICYKLYHCIVLNEGSLLIRGASGLRPSIILLKCLKLTVSGTLAYHASLFPLVHKSKLPSSLQSFKKCANRLRPEELHIELGLWFLPSLDSFQIASILCPHADSSDSEYQKEA